MASLLVQGFLKGLHLSPSGDGFMRPLLKFHACMFVRDLCPCVFSIVRSFSFLCGYSADAHPSWQWLLPPGQYSGPWAAAGSTGTRILTRHLSAKAPGDPVCGEHGCTRDSRSGAGWCLLWTLVSLTCDCNHDHVWERRASSERVLHASLSCPLICLSIPVWLERMACLFEQPLLRGTRLLGTRLRILRRPTFKTWLRCVIRETPSTLSVRALQIGWWWGVHK